MSCQVLRLKPCQMRRVLLQRQGLMRPPGRRLSKPCLATMLHAIGFVQVDSIATLERAHHMILFSRAQTYRRGDLSTLLERDRELFENWTHDASIIPSTFFPHWRHRFAAARAELARRWHIGRRAGWQREVRGILERIERNGELRARDLVSRRGQGAPGDSWWDWHPSKTALEFLWRTGRLAVSRREGFQKVYDLTERVIPQRYRDAQPSRAESVDWACTSALERLGVATAGELAAFWGAVTPREAAAWAKAQSDRVLVPAIIGVDGNVRTRRAYAAPDVVEQVGALPAPPSRMRILSAFDPVLRDRARVERLFGFHFRIEVFVPANRRRYGYYVCPLLEGERLVGRIDARAARERNALIVRALWWEPGIRAGAERSRRLDAELERLRRFLGLARVEFEDGWSRTLT